MAKKDLSDTYLEKLERITNLHEKGALTDQEYASEKLKLEKMKKGSAGRDAVAAAIVLAVIGLVVWGVMSSSDSIPSDAPRDLDISVRTSATSVELSNNETSALRSCTVEINKKYRSGIKSIDSTPSEYSLSSFVASDGERFDPLHYAVTSLVVSDCHNEKGRMGIYTN